MSTPDVDMGALSLSDRPKPDKSHKPRRDPHTKKVVYYKHALNLDQHEMLIWFVLTVLEGWTYIEESHTLIHPDTKKEYIVNPEFHVTVLFPRGSDGQAKVDTLESHLGKSVTVRATEVGVNEDFVCIRVECDAGEIPYYGNEVVHVTFAMAKPISDGKKPLAKDSYKALESGTVFRAEPETFSATFTAHMN